VFCGHYLGSFSYCKQDLRYTRFLWRKISDEETKSANIADMQSLRSQQAWTAHNYHEISPACLRRAMQRSPHLS
jgi:hypothetical protein